MTTSNQQHTFTARAGERLDKFLTDQLNERLTRTQVQTLIRDGGVRVDGVSVKPGIKLKGGERVEITIDNALLTPNDEMMQPEAIPLTILYEDAHVVVIDKPAGLIVHPGINDEPSTLAHALLSRYPQIAEIKTAARRRGIVHRLDKNTSGLIVVALNDTALHRMNTQFQARTVEKRYIALLERTPKTTTGRIDAPIGRDPNDRRRMAVLRSGRPAVSEFSVIERLPNDRALVRVALITGRTHQIRVHMAFIDCPLLGDPVYGFRRQRSPLKRQFLHAERLCFDHPHTGERLCFESPLPDDLRDTLDRLREGR